MGYQRFNTSKTKPLDIIIFIANILAVITGIIYLLYGSDSIYWNIYGVYMLMVLFCNAVYAFFDCKYDLKGYLYLGISILFMLLIPVFNLLVSLWPVHQSSRSMISCIAMLLLYAFGGFLAAHNIFRKKTDVELLLAQIAAKYEPEPKIRKVMRISLILVLTLFMLIGLFIAYSILFSNNLWETQIFISAFALFYVFLFLSAGLLVTKLLNKSKRTYVRIAYLLLTAVISISCLAPIISLPVLIKEADISYRHAFGNEYKTLPDYKNPYFRKITFSIPEYFFGTVTRDYTVRQDILFYSGKKGIDKDLKLYFDVYSSSQDGDMLPGGNSVLIRIHGGGWKSGDKGLMNNAQMNKYFASQGYVVFDIQYGLNGSDTAPSDNISEQRYRNFTLDDIVRHINIFLKYLADNHEEFNANIDSVFISGVSAGGNLALSSGLTYTNNKLKINGIIPFYPANALAESMGVAGSEVLSDPALNVDELSPPCLIFQGTHDGLVNSAITEQLLEEYQNSGNTECAIIYMLYGGHSSDIYFSGYYNQIFLYYMERFMFQYR
ncbi:MAG TPA: alpha/beta hydrolase fold domain-containing protein [Clostridiaceae bacterium]|nr:alpha/beta hydrolase fold domain-containing protein [Clostridiaceae bacterium]